MTAENLVIDVKRVFPIALDGLYSLCASPAFFRRCGARLDSGYLELHSGGAYEYNLEGGGRVWGRYIELVENEKIVMTWSTDHLDGPCENTLVTLTLRAIDHDRSELRLVHSGFGDQAGRPSHDDGWTDLFATLAEDFAGALGAGIRSGLKLRFSIPQRFSVPVSTVFDAFIRPEELSRFFVKEASGPLVPGERVQWHFTGHSPLTICCHEVIQNRLIRFSWGQASVRFEFEALAPSRSKLTIHCEGWEPNAAGLADSYEECEGWRHVLMCLKGLLEHGIVLDGPS